MIQERLNDFRFLTLLLIFSTLIFRLWIASWLGYGIGEAYYFRGALQLQLSYFDQPPLFFWLSGLFVKVLGVSHLSLRLPAILLFAGTSWLMFLVGKRLFSEASGFFAVLLLNLSLIFTIAVASWFQPDSPLLFFWMLSVYFIIHIFFPENNQKVEGKKAYYLWLIVGLSAGLGTLSKYHTAFLLAGVVLFILISKEHRYWLWHPAPYLAIGVMAVCALPVIIWNIEHNWISFVFQGSRAGSSEFKIHFDWFLRSIVGQSVWITPWIWLPLVWQLFRTFKLKAEYRKHLFIFSIAVLPIVFFTVITLWANTQFHFHWQAPGYMMLFLPLGAVVAQSIENKSKNAKWIKGWLIASATINFALLGIVAIHIQNGFLKQSGPEVVREALNGKLDPTMELVDFEEIRTRFETEGWLKNDSIFVGSMKWLHCGKIDWVLRAEKPMIIFHPDARNYIFFQQPSELLGKNAVVLALPNNKISTYLEPFFEHIEALPNIEIKKGNSVEYSYLVYYCTHFKVPEQPIDGMPLYEMLSGKSTY